MLLDYSDVLLQVLAELRGAYLDAADSREQAIELLAAQITDPTSVQMAYEEVGDYSAESHTALELLLKEGGEMAEAQFTRQFGGIRQMGPAKLEREMPWITPESTAELLYYYGLVGRSFKGTGQNAHTILYIPSDMAPWLPNPQGQAPEGALPVRPVPPPAQSRLVPADDSLLEDLGTLLGFLHHARLRLTPTGPHPEDIDQFVQRLQVPHTEGDPDHDVRLAFMLHLANRLGWLRRGDDNCVHLTGNRVQAFLEKTRAEQRQALWEGWRQSPDWNDLCRTPGLECAETGNWKNDPLQTRGSILQLFAKLHAGAWYSQSEVLQAIQSVEPDFQRPTGNYDTWYIRNTNTQEFLHGFSQWDAVEGALLRFLLRGPLHWLGAVDLAEPSAGDDWLISLSGWGSRWLGQETPQPHEAVRKPMLVHEDYTISAPLGTPLDERFRLERFADWRASYPAYVYQINQRSLKRAVEQGISTARIADFLNKHTRGMPAKVADALTRFGNSEKVKS
jgi:hypothetical protein